MLLAFPTELSVIPVGVIIEMPPCSMSARWNLHDITVFNRFLRRSCVWLNSICKIYKKSMKDVPKSSNINEKNESKFPKINCSCICIYVHNLSRVNEMSIDYFCRLTFAAKSLLSSYEIQLVVQILTCYSSQTPYLRNFQVYRVLGRPPRLKTVVNRFWHGAPITTNETNDCKLFAKQKELSNANNHKFRGVVNEQEIRSDYS